MSVYSASDELDEEIEAELHGEEPVRVEDSVPRIPLVLKPEAIASSHSSSTEYVTCASEISGSLRAQQGLDSGSHAYLSAEALDPRERSGVSLASTVTSEHAQTATRRENGSTGQLPFSQPPAVGVSGKVLPTPQATPPHTNSLGHSMKFNNLLDKCDATDSDIVKPKPSTLQPAPWSENPPSLVPPGVPLAKHQPPNMQKSSQLSTVSSRASTGSPIAISPTTVNTPDKMESLHEQTSPEASPSPLDGMSEDTGTLQPFLFPVSNSPVDLITMLSRLASFTGGLLTVLTPKIRKTSTRSSKVRRDTAVLVAAKCVGT